MFYFSGCVCGVMAGQLLSLPLLLLLLLLPAVLVQYRDPARGNMICCAAPRCSDDTLGWSESF